MTKQHYTKLYLYIIINQKEITITQYTNKFLYLYDKLSLRTVADKYVSYGKPRYFVELNIPIVEFYLHRFRYVDRFTMLPSFEHRYLDKYIIEYINTRVVNKLDDFKFFKFNKMYLLQSSVTLKR